MPKKSTEETDETSRVLIDQKWLAKVPLPAKGAEPKVYMDTKLNAFGVRVTSGGTKSFIIQRREAGRKARRVFKQSSETTVAGARITAQLILGRMAAGERLKDIIRDLKGTDAIKATNAAEERTFGKVYREYLAASGDPTFNKDGTPRDPEPTPAIPERKVKGRSPETIRDRRKLVRLLGKKAVWKTPIGDLTADQVGDAIRPMFAEEGIKTRSLSNGWKCLRYGRAAFNWECMRTKGELRKEANPFAAFMSANPDLEQPEARQRRLILDEASSQTWLKALVDARQQAGGLKLALRVAADYFICVALFGGRRTETLRLCLNHLNLDQGEPYAAFVKENTKGGRAHMFPLTPWAVDILRARIADLNAEAAKSGRAIPGPAGGWLFNGRTREDFDADKLPPSPYGLRELLKHLEKTAGVRFTAHDLRRTLAAQVASQSEFNLGLVALALNHSPAEKSFSKVTKDYIGDAAKVATLRPHYLKWERTLRVAAGLQAPTPAAELSEAMQAALKDPAMRAALRAALDS